MFSKAATKIAELLPKNPYVMVKESPVVRKVPNPPEICAPTRSKPTFDVNKVLVEPAHMGTVDDVETFLFIQHFKHQPTIVNLQIDMKSNYLNTLAKKYTTSGDRWLAYQLDPKMRKRRLVGALAAYKKFPWEVGRLDNWAVITPRPESYHIYFCAHCMRSPDVFSKYRIPYVYDIELVTTAMDTMGYGIEDLLLQTAFRNALETEHYPLIQVLSTNNYLDGACVRAGMTLEWSMKLADMVNERRESLFYSKTPPDENATVNLYVRLFCPKKETILYHPKTFVKQNPVL